MSAPSTTAAPAPGAGFDEGKIERLTGQMTSPWKLRAFLATKLPLALFAGLRVRHLDREGCSVTLPYGWRSTNPFRSIYFAAQAMAAEMSTGAPILLAVRSAPASVAMLVVGMEATFGKKADSLVTFTCDDGRAAFEAVERTLETGEGETVRLETVGRLADGAEVARFVFTWSVKRRRSSESRRP